MAKTSEKKTIQREELKEVFTLWKRKSKSGQTYFTGRDADGKRIVGFFITNKKNPKQPDLNIFYEVEQGEKFGDPALSLWCNVSEKSGKKYLSGKDGEVSYVGFISESDNAKRPYVRVYERDSQMRLDAEDKKRFDAAEEKPKTSKNPF